MLLFCRMCSKIIKNISSHYWSLILCTMLYFLKFPGKSFLECEIISTFLPWDRHTQTWTNNSKKICDVYLLWKQTRCSWCVLSCVHVKEIDLSKQGSVHNKKVERAWEGFLSWVVARRQQPQHSEGPRWLPIDPFHCISPFPCSKTPGAHQGASLPHLSQASPDPVTVPHRCPSDQGVRGGCWLPVYFFCYISKSGLPCSLPFMSFAVPSVLPLLLPQLRALRPQSPSSQAASPPLCPPLLSQSEAWKLVISSPSVPS